MADGHKSTVELKELGKAESISEKIIRNAYGDLAKHNRIVKQPYKKGHADVYGLPDKQNELLNLEEMPEEEIAKLL